MRDTLTAVLVSPDPARACGELVTERYVRSAYGDRAGCRRAVAAEPIVRSLKFGEVAISPGGAAATSVRPSGGVYDGERLRTELVLADGAWRLDRLRADIPVGP